VPATTLKVAGVDVFAGGAHDASEGQDELVWSDGRRGVYRKLVLDGDRLAGALLVGDTSLARELSVLLRSGESVPPELLDPTAPRLVAEPSDEQLVCSCNEVTRGAIVNAIRFGKLKTLAQVAQATRASTGCGSCAGDVQALLAGT
jgi:NAD(P)H-nitrite reductase large subunit